MPQDLLQQLEDPGKQKRISEAGHDGVFRRSQPPHPEHFRHPRDRDGCLLPLRRLQLAGQLSAAGRRPVQSAPRKRRRLSSAGVPPLSPQSQEDQRHPLRLLFRFLRTGRGDAAGRRRHEHRRDRAQRRAPHLLYGQRRRDGRTAADLCRCQKRETSLAGKDR